MYACTVLRVLELFREASVGCEIGLGLTSMPSRSSTLNTTKNFLYVSMADGVVDVQMYVGVEDLLKIGDVEEILRSSKGIGYHFEKGERISLPYEYYIFSYCRKTNYMRQSRNVLKEDSVVIRNSAVSINHTVQLLEILFKSFGNKMQFTLTSRNFPNQLVVIHYVNGNAFFTYTDRGNLTLYCVNLFKFKEFFGDYKILHVAKSDMPVDYAQFVSERSALAHRLGLEFREVKVC